ncbi:hypothetical protein ACIRPK_07260 [Kitasatospora sp. NPDC101801]|uniref:hypothetical protein n=1 Tax=Kitasatospora sp. NPDC101801 TaxID=3364103 RepID=UPI003815A59E
MSPLRWTTGAAGAALLGYGVLGLLTDPQIADPLDVLVWSAGAVVIHDGLWMPLVLLAGAVTVRSPAVRAALAVAAAISVIAVPAVLRADEDHGNPSVLPLPYLRNWLLLLAAVAAATALAAGWNAARRRRLGLKRTERP